MTVTCMIKFQLKNTRNVFKKEEKEILSLLMMKVTVAAVQSKYHSSVKIPHIFLNLNGSLSDNLGYADDGEECLGVEEDSFDGMSSTSDPYLCNLCLHPY